LLHRRVRERTGDSFALAVVVWAAVSLVGWRDGWQLSQSLKEIGRAAWQVAEEINHDGDGKGHQSASSFAARKCPEIT